MALRMSLRSIVVAGLLASAPVLAADKAKAPDTPVPLLWKVSDQDNAVYLLGSFHLLRADDYPLSPDVDAAFADAEHLVFELDPEEMQSTAVQQMMLQAALRTDGKLLQQELDAATWKRLETWAGANSVPLVAFNSMEPWFVGLTITIVEMTRQGLDPKLGLDNHFMDKARAAGKQAGGLEKAQEQIAVLDGMAATEQQQFIVEALDQAEKGSVETERMHQAWRSGDAVGLWEGMAADMRVKYPELYRRINVDRNDAWVPKLEQLLKQPGNDDALVVVGALHLLGEDGVVEKLRARGYTVERICSACQTGTR